MDKKTTMQEFGKILEEARVAGVEITFISNGHEHTADQETIGFLFFKSGLTVKNASSFLEEVKEKLEEARKDGLSVRICAPSYSNTTPYAVTV